MLKKLLFAVNLAALALTILFQTLETKAAWGDFDTSFGFQGLAIDPITSHFPRKVSIQPDGKILVTGYKITVFGSKGFFLRRYLSTGQLDTTFGSGGAATSPEVNNFNSDYVGENIVVQADGKIAVSGKANGYYAVWQFASNGKADRTFGQDGLQILTQYPADIHLPELNIQSGKLLLTFPKSNVNGEPIVLIRLNLNGTIDQTFGNFGESLTNLQGNNNGFKNYFGTVIESTGKITVGGKNSGNLIARGLERKLANGQTDPTFFPTSSTVFNGVVFPGLVKMSNGKYAIRLNNLASNGSITLILDNFSSTGIFESSVSLFNGFSYRCPDIFTNQNDGKVLVGANGVLVRINAELDFSTLETNYCSNLSGISNLARAAIQPDDKMVVAGIYNNNLMLARLLPN